MILEGAQLGAVFGSLGQDLWSSKVTEERL